MFSRDLSQSLKDQTQTMEAILLWGPRQTGKTTLISNLPNLKSQVYLDDLQHRRRAGEDPSLFLDGFETPVLIDECAYAPELFPEIKLRIDAERRENLRHKKKKKVSTKYYLTCSNKSMLDRNIKESLAGRIRILSLSGLSVSEILLEKPNITLKHILFRGGLPELYSRPELNPIPYLNDYIITYLEKDLARGEGYGKIREFQTVLRLLSARSGQFVNFSEISNASGVSVPTIQNWISLLENNKIISLVPCYSTNLTKRLVKMKKLHFFDTGLASRLQGQPNEEVLWNSPQAGFLFESIVYSEIQKTKDNFLKDWGLFTWRTKEKNEIDFILESGGSKRLFIEVKMGVQNVDSWVPDPEAKKVFGDKFPRIVVTAGNRMGKLGEHSTQIPLGKLKNYLLEFFE